MDYSKLRLSLLSLSYPSPVLRVTFNKVMDAGVLCALSKLYQLHQDGVIELEQKELMVLLAVIESHNWDGDRNRTFDITILRIEAKVRLFEDFENTVEAVKPQHQFSALLSSRHAQRQKAAEVIKFLLTSDENLKNELAGWGVTLEIEPLVLDPSEPRIAIRLKSGSDVIGRMSIDGFSGCLIVEGKQAPFTKTGFKDLCLDLVMDYCDK